MKISLASSELFRLSSVVSESDVGKAIRLMKEAKDSTLQREDIECEHADQMSCVYGYIREHFEKRRVS